MNNQLKVQKRNLEIVDFDWHKIQSAVLKAFNSCDIKDDKGYSYKIAQIVFDELSKESEEKQRNIEHIQDIVERSMADLVSSEGFPYEVMKKYILYRDRRNKDRESINKLANTFHDIVDIEDNDTKKSNANINGNTPAGQMMIFASESSKQHAFDYIVNPKYVQAHKEGYIHIHDADYISTKAVNCNQIDLLDLFNKKFIFTNDSIMRPPKRIHSYGALAAIALQSEQNEMYGGQSICNWDYAMADGVRKTFVENFKKYANALNTNISNIKDEDIKIANSYLKLDYPAVFDLAYNETVNDTHEAVAAMIYNLCSMHSRGGGQIVFSSINYGTDDSPEGRIVIEQTLNAIDEGLGDGSTAIFPISVFKVKNDINFTMNDWELAKNNWEDAIAGKLRYKAPNFDLFIKACEVSSRRLFPNFVFLDSPYNQNDLWKYDDPNRYKYELAVMGCRTRVYDDIYGEKTSARRGNLSFTTINLPRLAIESRLECIETRKEFDQDDVINIFYKKLDYYMNLVKNQLLERYHWQCSAYGRQFPFIVSNKTILGTEEIDGNDKMEKALKHGTLSIGFIGLAEALKEITGFHHGENDEAQELGIEIIKRMRAFTDKATVDEKLNFSVFATPAEGLSGRMTSIDRKQFGSIDGVTDKEYYTNSQHVPVYYKITAAEKIKKEAPYHALCNAGSIAYVEMDGDPRKNVLAFANIVVEMKFNNVNYGAINHSVDRCINCNYEGIIEDECPKCGEKERIDHLRRITGYLVGNTDRWNSYKLAELRDRKKHI